MVVEHPFEKFIVPCSGVFSLLKLERHVPVVAGRFLFFNEKHTVLPSELVEQYGFDINNSITKTRRYVT